MHSRDHAQLSESIGWSCRKRVDISSPVATPLSDLPCVYDEPLRCAPHEEERIAGHECQVAAWSGLQNADGGRLYNLSPRNRVFERARRSLHVNHVVRTNQAQRAEVGIAMRRDSHVAAG